ncbi:MAG TPA: hypothetical protein VF975_04515 [Thermoanaerobaculia bacterium]
MSHLLHLILATLGPARVFVVAMLAAVPASAQSLFPRLSLTGGSYFSRFSTDMRADSGTLEGTEVNAERELGLTSSKRLKRFTLEWRPFERHEFETSYFSASRNGFRDINGPIVFNGQTYPAQAQVTTNFALKYWDLTYTAWVHRSERDGVGLTLGVARIAVNASLFAQRPGETLTITEEAATNVPVAMVGAQARFALTPSVFLEGRAEALPRVHIDVYSGRALIANVLLEYRITRNIGLGGGYNYSRIDGTVNDPRLNGNLAMTIDGAEGYLRIAFGR